MTRQDSDSPLRLPGRHAEASGQQPASLECLEPLSLAHPDRCTVAPSPELRDKIMSHIEKVRNSRAGKALATYDVRTSFPRRPGLNDGLIIPGSFFPLGTPLERVRSAGADRAPLRGVVRVVVVLVDFADQPMARTVADFDELFFSQGQLATGSVREYFTEATNGLVDIQGAVVGPYRLPQSLAAYANGASGLGGASPNARTMARDALAASDPDVNFAPYDNDGNGFVDAFVVIHAGPGAEQTGGVGDIWSHKWVLEGGAQSVDGTQVYGYLTVPEDARIGVCAHELGHLLFGFPDLYDTDGSSEGLGNWCLMAGGSWNGGGDTPAHPSAWCKVNQGWANTVVQTTNSVVNIADVKDGQTVYRLWKDGAPGQEYFLVENRQRNRFDAALPGDGLLVWHIDEAAADNTDESHYKVALMQADGQRDLEHGSNRGDAGDPYPGSSGNVAFTNTSTPNSKSYAGVNTCVSVTAIGASAPVMSAQLAVRCVKAKDIKDGKEGKEFKERFKEFKEPKEFKERFKEFKEPKEFKERFKEFKEGKELLNDKHDWEKPNTEKAIGLDKPQTDKVADKLIDGRWPASAGVAEAGSLEERVAAIEGALGLRGEPFISAELRPDLRQGALSAEDDAGLSDPLVAGDAGRKRFLDTKQSDS